MRRVRIQPMSTSICFRGTQTVPVAARNERLTPQQRIVTRIILDISRCPHGPVVSRLHTVPHVIFTCPGTSFEPCSTIAIRCVSRYLSHDTIRITIRAENYKMDQILYRLQHFVDIDSLRNGLVYFINNIKAKKCQGTDKSCTIIIQLTTG